ncbi:3-isopropylmalate dehydratase small subunit [bacterium TMED277]|nr:MAG: 3-isopropylmalate dehydratase small subunit [bacterium TMED277]
MEKFHQITGDIAAIELSNIDTDMIIPKQFLKTIKRSGLSRGLFFEMRFDQNGKKNSDFILNKKPFDRAKILLSFDNFGCGSSREHAPWAILDFGIKTVIAKSFADIFYNNCFKNGILPIRLKGNEVNKILSQVKEGNYNFSINLKDQKISNKNLTISFEIDSYKKECLLNGWDEIDLTLKEKKLISEFEKKISNWVLPNKNNE